jgi:multiple sugar transport system permease protein
VSRTSAIDRPLPIRRSRDAARGWSLGWRLPLAGVVALPFVVPFLWLVASALKPISQFYAAPPALLPDPPSLANLEGVLRLVDVPRLFGNSLAIAGTSVALTVLSSAVVGFAFATQQARGRRLLFAILLVTIMVPPSATIVPQFILFSRLDWVGTWLPLIVPNAFGSAFFIFLFRQWFKGLPAHVFENAELDGATPWQVFRHVAMPLSGPAVAAVAVFAFVGSWNDFLAPLVYLRSPGDYTISLGLASFAGIHVNEVHHALALALIALVPPVVVVAVAQRFLLRGIATTGWRV